jgi:PhoPQ-activated pathogenicity-related protein
MKRLVLGALAGLLAAAPASAGLLEYVRKPEPAYAWKLAGSKETPAGTVYDIDLVSQTWQGITWKHRLQVYQPKGVAPAETMTLINTGGGPGATGSAVGLLLAQKIGAPVAVLFDIPNQPLFDGKKEDALIAETFVRFLEGKGQDESWPLLFPMAKSVVKAMDTLQAFSKEHWKKPLTGFIVSGGSKRGWTTWLTAAADERVKAAMPMVIDTLNMPAQMKHQLDSYGAYSLMIHDYVERKLVPMPDTDEARKLWQMVDPYLYRDRVTMPKLIVNGANDPYWTVDALNLYWDDLKGDKYVLIVPNAGHNLRERLDGKEQPIPLRAVDTLAAFAKAQINGKPMPKLSWKHDDDGGGPQLTVTASPAPKESRLWWSQAPTRDFRSRTWQTAKTLTWEDGKITAAVVAPKEGFLALYGEVDFDVDGLTLRLSTQVRVLKAK